ncbi:unnamed protein product [Arabidopsis halleri]
MWSCLVGLVGLVGRWRNLGFGCQAECWTRTVVTL